MREEPRKSRKKKHHHGDEIMKKVLTALLALIAVLMTVLIIFALRIGINAPVMSSGTVVSASSTETEAPTQTQPEESTEPSTEEPSSTEPVTEADPNLEKAQVYLDSLTLEQKVGQMIFATPDSLTGVTGADIAGNMTRQALERYPVGGVVYFSQNIRSESQITDMVQKMQEYATVPMFMGVDEEGGRVSRLSRVGITDTLDPMATYGEAGDAEAVRGLGESLGQQLLTAGFNLDFAPVADVITNANNTEIGDRSFSTDPTVAAKMVAAMTEGLQQSGVSACLKHFPGHGSTSVDSHTGESVSHRTLDELRATEFVPFQAGMDAGVGMIMISHMSLPEITGETIPCDLSSVIVTDLLRQELGYAGVIITDSHEMASITSYYECGEAAIMAVQAGCDIVLMPRSISEAYEALLSAVKNGEVSEERINESVLRILALKIELGIIE